MFIHVLELDVEQQRTKNKKKEKPKNKYQKLLNIIKDCLRNTTSTNPMNFQKQQQQNVSKENRKLKQIEVQRIDKKNV